MSNVFVLDLKSGVDFGFGLSEKFLAICPDEVWTKKFGGWPVSHQFYHNLSSVPFFIGSFVSQMPANPCPEAGNLESKADSKQPTKEQAGAYLASLKATMETVFAGLSDADLLKRNDRCSEALGKDTTNASVLSLLAAHMLYHLGSCDAALREQGLEGAF